MANLRHLAFHLGAAGAPPRDPERLFDRYPKVQRAAFCVADHFLWHLGRVDLCAAGKLILRVDPNVRSLERANLQRLLNVRTLAIPFDLNVADTMEGDDLKRLILDSIVQSLTWIALIEEVDSRPIQGAYESVLSDGLAFGFHYKRGKVLASANQQKAKIFLRFDWDRYDVIAEVFEGRRLLGHLPLHSTVPVESPLPSLVRKIQWTPGGKISLQTIDFSTATKLTITKSIQSLRDGPASPFPDPHT